MIDYMRILRNEFIESEESFIVKLRTEFVWDKEAFSQLVDAMRSFCEANEDAEALDRWMAGGFWTLSTFVQPHTMHPSFPREYPQEYYDKAFKRLEDLAYWYFVGKSPYLDNERGFHPM